MSLSEIVQKSFYHCATTVSNRLPVDPHILSASAVPSQPSLTLIIESRCHSRNSWQLGLDFNILARALNLINTSDEGELPDVISFEWCDDRNDMVGLKELGERRLCGGGISGMAIELALPVSVGGLEG